MSDTVRDGLARALDPVAFTDWTGARDPRALPERRVRQMTAFRYADAALAYRAGQRVDVEAVARARSAADYFELRTLTSPGSHGGSDRRWALAAIRDLADQAEQIAALLPTAPEVVTTAAELDALPVGSVVLDGMGDAWQRSDASIDWWAPSNPFYCESDALNILELGGTDNPPRVLYRPTVDGAR